MRSFLFTPSLNLSLFPFLVSFSPFPPPLFSHSSLCSSNPSLIFYLFSHPSIELLLQPSPALPPLFAVHPSLSIHLSLIPSFFVHPRTDPSSSRLPPSFKSSSLHLLLHLNSPPAFIWFLPVSHLFLCITLVQLYFAVARLTPESESSCTPCLPQFTIFLFFTLSSHFL